MVKLSLGLNDYRAERTPNRPNCTALRDAIDDLRVAVGEYALLELDDPHMAATYKKMEEAHAEVGRQIKAFEPKE